MVMEQTTFFEIPGIQYFPAARVEIYNRWGSQIFESTGYEEPWDGTYDGNKLPIASYYYVIDLGNGQTYTGDVTIIR